MKDWEKGDTLKSIQGAEIVTFLGYSDLNSDCFIAENKTGNVYDDYMINSFVLDNEKE